MGVWDCIDRGHGDKREHISFEIVEDCKRGLEVINAWLPQHGLEDTAFSRTLSEARVQGLASRTDTVRQDVSAEILVTVDAVSLV